MSLHHLVSAGYHVSGFMFHSRFCDWLKGSSRSSFLFVLSIVDLSIFRVIYLFRFFLLLPKVPRRLFLSLFRLRGHRLSVYLQKRRKNVQYDVCQ